MRGTKLHAFTEQKNMNHPIENLTTPAKPFHWPYLQRKYTSFVFCQAINSAHKQWTRPITKSIQLPISSNKKNRFEIPHLLWNTFLAPIGVRLKARDMMNRFWLVAWLVEYHRQITRLSSLSPKCCRMERAWKRR